MHDHLERLARSLDARPAELVGLVVLLAGGLLATALLLRPTADDLPPGPVLIEDGATAADGRRLTVHVAGAVRQPGVVELAAGARVADAVAAAGGARVDAVLDALNLAARVEDGQQVLVPSSQATADPTAVGSAGAIDADGRVDLNRASAAELETLPGIGPVLAERIVAWREQHGPFASPGDLRQVPGIGERTFQSLADRIRV